MLTLDVQPEAVQAGHGDNTRVVDVGVEDVHREGGRAVDDGVARVQHAPHEQVYELVRTAANLRRRQASAWLARTEA